MSSDEHPVPPGFDGFCQCGNPGHLQGAPDGAYSAIWCDNCVPTGTVSPISCILPLIMIGAIAAGAWLILTYLAN